MDPCFRARRGGRPKSRRMLGREAIMREIMCRDWQRSHTTRDSVNTLLCPASSILLFLSAWHFSPFNKLFFLLPFHLRNGSAFFCVFFDSTSTLAQSLTYIPPLSSHCSMPELHPPPCMWCKGFVWVGKQIFFPAFRENPKLLSLRSQNNLSGFSKNKRLELFDCSLALMSLIKLCIPRV